MRPFVRTPVIDGRDAIPTRPPNEMPMMKCEARSIVNPFTRTFRKKVPAF